MKEQFREYIISLYQDVPTEAYEGLLSIFFLGSVGLIAFLGWQRGWRKVLGLLLTEYVFLIYCSTVICRNVAEGVFGYNFSPFWSYEAIKNGREELIAENIMNVVAFLPVGTLLGGVAPVSRFKTWVLVLVTGVVISGSIEALQYFLKRGFSEVDDVFHNTIGCLMGLMLVAIIKGIWLLQRRYLIS